MCAQRASLTDGAEPVWGGAHPLWMCVRTTSPNPRIRSAGLVREPQAGSLKQPNGAQDVHAGSGQGGDEDGAVGAVCWTRATATTESARKGRR